MTPDQIADRLIILKANAEASIDEDSAAGARLKLARFVMEHFEDIITKLRAPRATYRR